MKASAGVFKLCFNDIREDTWYVWGEGGGGQASLKREDRDLGL